MKSAPARATPFALLSWALYPGARLLAGLLSLLVGIWVCELSIPLLLGDTVDAAVSRIGGHTAMVRFSVLAFAVAAILYVLHRAYLRAETSFVARGTFRLRRHLYGRVLEQQLGTLPGAHTGEVAQRLMSDTEVLDAHAIFVLADAPFSAMTVLGIFAVMLWMQPKLALLVSAVLILTSMLSSRAARPLPAMEQIVRHRWARLGGRLQETLDGFTTVKLFGCEDHEIAGLDSRGERLTRSVVELGKIVARLEPLLQLTTTLGFLAVVCYGSVLVYGGSLSAGRLVAFIAYMELICEPLRDAGAHLTHYQQSAGTLRRISSFLNELASPPPSGKRSVAGPFEVEMDNIHFSYAGEEFPVLDGISLRASPGEIVAITGENGAGKSTLMEIVLGLRRPDRGCVRIGAVPLDDWDNTAWREATAVVPQTIFLFHATIRANILYGSPLASSRNLEAAVEQADLGGVIARLPRGLDTIVGNSGEHLSGGERQRVALARAFLRKPRLLVLDEPASALDGRTLSRLCRVLRDNRKGRITFLVSHDHRVLDIADRMLVLQRGRVVASEILRSRLG